jgi:hypothetical protein
VSEKMPALFFDYGSAMNVMEENQFSSTWDAAGKALSKPKVVTSISAHSVTRGAMVTALEKPRPIYEFNEVGACWVRPQINTDECRFFYRRSSGFIQGKLYGSSFCLY